jgi:predicted nucleic-acid-binding protein
MLQRNTEEFMPEPVKKSATSHARPSSVVTLMLGWAQQGMDSFLATQRILVDFATKKNANLLKNLREGVFESDNSPMAILTELGVEATANLTEAQKILLSLAQQENEIIMTGVKERVSASNMAVAVAERVRLGIDTFVDMQQDFLTTISKHVQKRLEATQAGKGPDLACLTDAARDAMDNFVSAQKKFLDIIVMQEAKAKGGDSSKKKTEIPKLAREAADAFIEAQKKLLDLVGQQMNVNLQSASQAANMVKSFRPVPLPEFGGEQVKSFIDAEKALIESIIKPANGAKAAAKPERSGKRPARRRPAAAAESAQAGA